MKRYILFLVVILCFSCDKKNQRIEIYLLNRRVEIEDGIPYCQAKNITDSKFLEEYKYVKYDTLFKEKINAGRFNIVASDLQKVPFITNEEIESFNLNNDKIKFSSKAIKRIDSLSEHVPMHKGVQFVVTVNKNPQLTGYFMGISRWCDWYYISRLSESDYHDGRTTHILFNGAMRGKHEDLKPPYPQKLIDAFRTSSRLIEN